MMTDFDITETTVSEIHDAMRAGEVTSRELVDRYRERIEAYDRAGPELNGVVTLNPDAPDRAAELDETFAESGPVGPLHGIPVLVKDQAETAGLTTTFGSAVFEEYVPETDATVVRKLRDAGAVVLAKTNLCDWAASWFGYSSATGRTKNPYALARDPGGSSAGTGAGVAANLGTIGVGEDTGGSVRVPAAYCNLFGIRVTTGLISRTGFAPLVARQDTPGPMARTVADMARLLDVMVGYDPDDEWTGATAMATDDDYVDHLDADALDGARIGVLRAAFGADDAPAAEVEPVSAVVEEALAAMADAGATLVDPVSIPDLDEQVDDTSLYVLQAKRDLNDFLAERPGAPADSVEAIDDAGDPHPCVADLFDAIVDGPADPIDDPDYWAAVAAQERLRRHVVRVHAEHDLDAVAFPDVPVLPPTEEQLRDGTYTTMAFPTNTVVGSQSSCPAVSLPAGFTDEGIPVGVELLGTPFAEPRLIELAASYESAADPRRPPATAPPLDD